MAASFKSQTEGSKTARADGGAYLPEAAAYLAERGCTVDDFDIVPYVCKPMGWFTRAKQGAFEPFIPEGWAFNLGDGTFQMRVCNYPEEKSIYEERNGQKKKLENQPKFLTQGATLMWVSSMEELQHAPLVMLHEKATSATLCKKLLGVPSLAFMGCWGWSIDGKMKTDVRKVIATLEKGCKVAIMFDKDLTNPLKNISTAASKLAYLIGQINPEVEVVALEVPGEGKDGWDDWIVRTGPVEATEKLREMLVSPGITLRMPPEFWIETLGLSYRVTKQDGILIEPSLDNMCRLLTCPPWSGYFRDINGGYFDEETLEKIADSIDALYPVVARWMSENLWRGTGIDPSKEKVKDAIRTVINARERCVALERIKSWPEVTAEQAQEASQRFVRDAIRVTGPYDPTKAAIVIQRVFRDLCYLWSGKDAEHVQWVLALIGPQGCGKSSLFQNVLRPLRLGGYIPSMSPVPLNEEKAVKIARDSLVGIFDDWHIMDRQQASAAENVIYKLSTQAADMRANAKYMEDAQLCTRHAGLVLTTTPNNTQFLHSAKGSGERRFICLQVAGTVESVMGYNGQRLMTADYQLVQELAPILLRWGYQRMMAGDKAPANEWVLEGIERFQAREWAVEEMEEGNCTPDDICKGLRALLKQWAWEDSGARIPLAILVKAMRAGCDRPMASKLRASYRNVVEGLAPIHDGAFKCHVPGKKAPEARRDVVLVDDIEEFCASFLALF